MKVKVGQLYKCDENSRIIAMRIDEIASDEWGLRVSILHRNSQSNELMWLKYDMNVDYVDKWYTPLEGKRLKEFKLLCIK